jgi:hypothetical protein
LDKIKEAESVRETLTLTRSPNTLTLTGRDYRVTVTVQVQGLELASTQVEQMLHAPLGVLVEHVNGHAARSELPNRISEAVNPSALPKRFA